MCVYKKYRKKGVRKMTVKFKNGVGWVKMRKAFFRDYYVIKGKHFGKHTLLYYRDKQQALSVFKVLKDGLEQGQRLVEDGKL